jgi:hypothetical protein
MQKTISIQRKVSKSEEKTYIRVPFEVPRDTERIDIRYSHEGDGANSLPIGNKNVIDFALLDAHGNDIGATGSMHKHIVISDSYSSPGYKRIPPVPGVWTIILGAYLVKEDGVEVRYDIVFYIKERRYFKGDTHCHTINSDGKLTYEAIAEKAKKKGLDYLIITDHNNSTEGMPLPAVDGLTVIPGLEFTNFFGHMNMWGVTRPYDGSYAVNTLEEFLILNRQADERGAVQTLNHPFCSFCPWKWDKNFIYQNVEVWNGLMREDNLKAVLWWQKQLEGGRKLGAVGGSDYHGVFPSFGFLGSPVNVVHALSQSSEDILTALREGRSVILAHPKAPMLTIESGKASVGETVLLTGETSVTIRAEKLRRGETLKIYNQSGAIYTYRAKKSAPYSVTLPVKEKGFVRAEIERKYPPVFRFLLRLILHFTIPEQAKHPIPAMPFAITNPIYFEVKETLHKSLRI